MTISRQFRHEPSGKRRPCALGCTVRDEVAAQAPSLRRKEVGTARAQQAGVRFLNAFFVACAALGSWPLAGCAPPDQPQPLRARPSGSSHPVTIRQPVKLTSVESGGANAAGQPARVNCVSCHSLRQRDTLPTEPSELKQFHTGLRLAHGALACGDCHQSPRPDGLHLADGTPLDLADVVRLCSQCHGPQFRDYQHGAHGGMQGHWDRHQGPRLRNSCVDCHDPHAPAYPAAAPVLPPRDRSFVWPEEGHAHD